MAAAGPTNSAHEDSAHSVFMAIQWGKCANRQSPQHAGDLSVGVPPLFSDDDVVRIAVVNKIHVHADGSLSSTDSFESASILLPDD